MLLKTGWGANPRVNHLITQARLLPQITNVSASRRILRCAHAVLMRVVAWHWGAIGDYNRAVCSKRLVGNDAYIDLLELETALLESRKMCLSSARAREGEHDFQGALALENLGYQLERTRQEVARINGDLLYESRQSSLRTKAPMTLAPSDTPAHGRPSYHS